MTNPIKSAGEAMPKAPTISDLQADLSRLCSLMQIIDDLVGDITAEGMDDRMRSTLFKAQNIASVAMEFSENLDHQFDVYMAARAKARQEA